MGIQVCDKGGGVPFELSGRIWEYMFTTTPTDLQTNFQAGGPISGPGMGLPLCRLYTQYLGGSLDLMSMPGVGTDVYLFLTRLDCAAELRGGSNSTKPAV